MGLFEHLLGDGDLLGAVIPHIRYERAYAVLPEGAFDTAARKRFVPDEGGSFGEVMTEERLGALRTPGPTYRGETADERIPGRYEAWGAMLRNTLPRLVASPTFLTIVDQLREGGWRDWHILQALGNQVLNYRIAELGEDMELELMRNRYAAPNHEPLETPGSPPAIPVEQITIESLRFHLEMSFAATIDALGLTIPQGVTRAEIGHVLASRYSYWEADAPHDDPFSIPPHP